MEQKLSKLRNCFRQESCKCFACDHEKDLVTDPIAKARILDAEVHKDLLNEDLQCSKDRCWECTNILC